MENRTLDRGKAETFQQPVSHLGTARRPTLLSGDPMAPLGRLPCASRRDWTAWDGGRNDVAADRRTALTAQGVVPHRNRAEARSSEYIADVPLGMAVSAVGLQVKAQRRGLRVQSLEGERKYTPASQTRARGRDGLTECSEVHQSIGADHYVVAP